MAFAITAEFPLGFYQGRDRFGDTERYPSFARAYSALVGAAYARTRLDQSGSAPSTHRGGGSAGTGAIPQAALSDDDTATLDWLERHAPDAITVPRSERNLGGQARAFRRKGWGQNAHADSPDKPAAGERAVARAALDGPLIWWWRDDPPQSVAARIDDLAAEVPYLGEAASPVRLRASQRNDVPSDAWRRDDDAIDIAGAQAFDLPAPGRADVLQHAYAALQEQKTPTLSQDKARSSANAEKDHPDPWPAAGLRQQVLYAPPQRSHTPGAPWVFGYLLHVRPVRPSWQRYWRPDVVDRVGWAEATHRAIVKQLGPDAGGLITGKYAPGEIPPPNRVAIHVLDAGMPLAAEAQDAVGKGRSEHATILVALPGFEQGTTADDLDRIETALSRIRRIALDSEHVIEVTDVELSDATAIWAAPEPGVQRWWFPHPLIVAESRPPSRTARGGREWTAGDAIRVAVGNVFRGRPELHTEARGDRRLVELSDLVHRLGVRIGSPRRAYPSQAGKYVHRVNPESVITAVQGLIHLGPLTNDRALVALGQSRHFAGGLLIPFDLPALPDAEQPDATSSDTTPAAGQAAAASSAGTAGTEGGAA